MVVQIRDWDSSPSIASNPVPKTLRVGGKVIHVFKVMFMIPSGK